MCINKCDLLFGRCSVTNSRVLISIYNYRFQQIDLFISIKCFRVTFEIMWEKKPPHGVDWAIEWTCCMLANRVSSIGFYLEFLIVYCFFFLFAFRKQQSNNHMQTNAHTYAGKKDKKNGRDLCVWFFAKILIICTNSIDMNCIRLL